VEKISISRTELDELKIRCKTLETCLEDVYVNRFERSGFNASISPDRRLLHVPNQTQGKTGEESQATEGRLLHDLDGNTRYLGETSGATFLDCLKEFMTTVSPLAVTGSWPPNQGGGSAFLSSLGRYQTFDSRPLHEPDVDPLWLPDKSEMISMLSEVRYLIQDGNGEFPSGGIYWWGDLGSVPTDPVSVPIDASDLNRHRHLALYHTTFAMSCQALLQN
jgi:hypothetical protein